MCGGGGGPGGDSDGPSASGGVSPGGGNTGGRAGPTGNEATGPGDIGGAAPGGDTGGRSRGEIASNPKGATPGIAANPQSTPGQTSSGALGAVGDAVGGAISDVGDTIAGAFGDDTSTAERGVGANVGNQNMSTFGQTTQVSAGPGTVGQTRAVNAAMRSQAAHPAVDMENVSPDDNDVQSLAGEIQGGLEAMDPGDEQPGQATAAGAAATLGDEGTHGVDVDTGGVASAIGSVVDAAVPGLGIETHQSPINSINVTHATGKPFGLVGTAAGVPTGAFGYNADEALGTDVALGTSVSGTQMSADEAEAIGVSRGQSSDPDNPGGPFGGPGGSDQGGGDARRSAGVGGAPTPQPASQPAPQPSGAFDTQGYTPYEGDVSTYGQPGGTASHTWFPDITAGVQNAWDSAMKGTA